MERWREELYHHGIAGMKWGVRNGPPYPLNSGGKDRHSAAEKRASKGGTKGLKTKAPEQKEGLGELAVIALIYTVPFIPYIAVSISNKIAQNKRDKFAKECDKERETAETDKKTGLKIKANKDATQDEDMKRVNPKYNPKETETTMNCVNCTLAYEMRRRGYEVQAQPHVNGRDGQDVAKKCFNAKTTKISDEPDIPPEKDWKKMSEDDRNEVINKLTTYYIKMDRNKMKPGGNKELAQKAIDTLSKEPDSRGQILVRWDMYSGHSMAYEVKDGKVTIYDCQINKKFEGKAAEKLLAQTDAIKFQRYDDKKVNIKEIKKGVQ